MAKDFHIGDIISAATGVLVSPRHIDGVYDILGFMTGESLFTHQLPRVGREAESVLLRQHPELAAAFEETKQVTRENWKEMLDGWVARYGEMLPVEPFTVDEHEYREPISELAEKVHPSKIIAVKI